MSSWNPFDSKNPIYQTVAKATRMEQRNARWAVPGIMIITVIYYRNPIMRLLQGK